MGQGRAHRVPPHALKRALGASILCSLSLALVACVGDDSANPLPSDAGALDASAYPTFAPPLPRIRSFGGPVLAHARIVPIVYASDDPTMRASIEDFVARVGGSSYFATAAAEYGVGAATATPPVVLNEAPPAAIDDVAIMAWLGRAALGGDAGADGGAPLPAADGNTIYVVFYPAGTTVTLQGPAGSPPSTSCAGFGAYHSEARLADESGATPYAVVPRCDSYLGVGGLDFVTIATAHELLEAATDPFAVSHGAFADTDFAGSGWAFSAGGPEVADLCKLDPTTDYQPPDLPYRVPRIWSNAQAAAGHDPCVPHVDGEPPYFGAFPALEGVEVVPGYYVSGVAIAPGASKTIDVRLFSDAPTGGPWTVTAEERGSAQAPSDPQHLLSFAWDRTTGSDGDVLHLTITRALPDGASTEALPFVIESTLGATTRAWWSVVGQ